MGRLHVEAWAPDYGSPFEIDGSLLDDAGVDEAVEVVGRWGPIDGVDDGVERVAFVDGVRRIDARLTIDSPVGPVPGLCGSYGVGAVVWDRTLPASAVEWSSVYRLAVFGGGQVPLIPIASLQLVYRSVSVLVNDPGVLMQRFHAAMSEAEGQLSEELGRSGLFVVSDGPISDSTSTEKVGYIKSHRARYLSDERATVVAQLGTGQRTPLFLIGEGGTRERYSWYARLATIPNGHSWSGVVRSEISAVLPVDRAVCIANRVTALLPLVASEEHVDPRAPQNLVPIAAVERELRRQMGDPGLVYRELRAAVMRYSEVEA